MSYLTSKQRREKRLCQDAEKFGARITWANQPGEFEHHISFTPAQLRCYVQHRVELSRTPKKERRS